MAGDISVGLNARTRQFDESIQQSQNLLKKFDQIGTSVKGSISSVLDVVKGYAAPLLAAAGAGEAFNRVMRGSQTTSDALDANMRAVTTSVDAFFTSLSTGDFSVFDRGINSIIAKAKEANAALDQLGNTVISYDYFSSKNNAAYAEKLATSRDKSKSKEERQQALNDAKEIYKKQEEYTNQLVNTTIDAVKKVATETAGFLNADDISYSEVEDVLRLDVSKNRDEEKAALTDKYNELLQIRENFKKQFTTSITMQSSAGAYSQSTIDWTKVNEAMQPYLESYKDAILYNEILVKKDDDWLKSLVGNMTKANSGMMAMASMKKQLVRADNSLSSGSGGNKPKVDSTDLAAWNAQGWANEEAKGLHKREIPITYVPQIEEEAIPDEELEFNAKINIPDNSLGNLYDQLNKKEDALFNMDVKLYPNAAEELKKEIKKLKKKIGKVELDIQSPKEKIEGTFEDIAQTIGSSDNLKEAGAAAGHQLIESLKAEIVVKAIASCMDLPFPANIIAAPMAAAAVTGLFSLIPAFANGGIFESPLTSGDKNLARLNGGEMILNKGQQANLFKMLDNGSPINSGGQVKFKISGKELVGVLSNYNNQISKIK